MKRIRQSVDEILERLTSLETTWRDEMADAVLEKLAKIPSKNIYSQNDIEDILDVNDGIYQTSSPKTRFDAGLTTIRLFLDLSKDEFTHQLQSRLGKIGTGIKRWNSDRDAYLEALQDLGVFEAIPAMVNQPVTWVDILTERLKGGRGSAIKGQSRGRNLEDYVEAFVSDVFGKGNFAVRCRFTGATGLSTEKCDFAIPNDRDPSILIEVKGYGATGSKQTDIIGDTTRIIQEKRHDTSLLLFTDGITWKARVSDLKKLVDMQNQGQILKIYTKSMANDFRQDLLQLQQEFGL